VHSSFANIPMDLELEDPEDMQLLLEEFPDESKVSEDLPEDNLQDKDELEALKDDLGDLEFTLPEDEAISEEIKKKTTPARPQIMGANAEGNDILFDIGREEKELL
jgi:hypothetical protein